MSDQSKFMMVTICASLSFVGVLRSDGVTRECTAAGGDLADETTWGGPLPGEEDALVFRQPGGTFTLSRDMTFGSVRLDCGNAVFDFGQGGVSRTLTLTTPMDRYGYKTLFSYPEYDSIRPRTTFRGGVWKGADGTGNFDIVPLGFGAGYDFTMDGAVITNISACALFRRISNSRITLENSSGLFARGSISFLGGASGTNNVLEVASGSVLRMTGGGIDCGTSSANDQNSRVEVSGAGSAVVIDLEKPFNVGNETYGHFGLRVCDNATVGKVGTSGYVQIWGPESYVEILQGANAYFSLFDILGSHDRVLVSNATLTAQWRFALSKNASCHDNVFVLSGPETVFSTSISATTDIMGPGYANTFVIENGAKWAPKNSRLLGLTSNNVFRVAGNGSELDLGSGVLNLVSDVKAEDGGASNSVDNIIEILDGATVKAGSVRVQGMRNMLVVSNATLQTSDSDYCVWVGRRGTNCKLVISGSAPAIGSESAGGLIMQKNSLLRYEIPAEGYGPDHIPVIVSYFSAENAKSARLEIDCAEWAAKVGNVSDEIVLLKEWSASWYLSDWLATQDLQLPKNVRCFVRKNAEGNGKSLILKRRPAGMVIMVR